MLRVYLFDDLEGITEDLINKCLSVFPRARIEKINRYKRINDKKASAAAYLLLLYGLKECFGITAPTISYGTHGKPYLRDQHIFFSISHCPYGVICAISDSEIGADIQDIRHFSMDAAKRVCNQDELYQIESTDDKAALFTEFWTKKKAMPSYSVQG